MAVRFAIEGDLRFISHHDTMRVFERALSRAQLPVSFSEGFNPRVRLSLPVPRAVGVASQVEILVVQLGERMEPAVILDRLARQMPGGLALLEAWHLDDKEVLHAERVEYALDLIPPQVGPVTDAVNRLLAAETWPIERAEPGQRPKRLIDIRAFLWTPWSTQPPSNGQPRSPATGRFAPWNCLLPSAWTPRRGVTAFDGSPSTG